MGGVLNIGHRKKFITVQAPTRIPDGIGGFVMSWATVWEVWAAIWPISSQEKTEAMSKGVDITHRVNIQYRAKFSPSWRIKYGNRYFSIVGLINPLEANRELQMTCKEAA